MIGKKLRLALVALAFVSLSSALYLEGTGYAPFDRVDGTNPLCAIDPACRAVTPGEIADARAIFGDTVDFTNVKVFNRPNYISYPFQRLLGDTSSAEAPNGNVYMKAARLRQDDASALPAVMSILTHELTHVWQTQHGKVMVFGAANAYISANFNYKEAYNYDKDIQKPFSALGIEQQAELVQDYWNLRRHYHAADRKTEWAEKNCEKVRRLETKILEEIPVTPLDACQPPTREAS